MIGMQHILVICHLIPLPLQLTQFTKRHEGSSLFLSLYVMILRITHLKTSILKKPSEMISRSNRMASCGLIFFKGRSCHCNALQKSSITLQTIPPKCLTQCQKLVDRPLMLRIRSVHWQPWPN